MFNEPVTEPKSPKGKPYRVTAYCSLINQGKSFLVGDYRWYWQANLISWWWHQLGWGCNTWKKTTEE